MLGKEAVRSLALTADRSLRTGYRRPVSREMRSGITLSHHLASEYPSLHCYVNLGILRILVGLVSVTRPFFLERDFTCRRLN